MAAVRCQHCGGAMKKATAGGAGVVDQVMALGAGLLGIGLTLTCIGAILGIPLLIASSKLAKKPSRVWKCKACKSIIPRA